MKFNQILSAMPDGEPHEHTTLDEAITSVKAECIGRGESMEQKILVGVQLEDGRIVLIRVPLNKLDELKKLEKGYE